MLSLRMLLECREESRHRSTYRGAVLKDRVNTIHEIFNDKQVHFMKSVEKRCTRMLTEKLAGSASVHNYWVQAVRGQARTWKQYPLFDVFGESDC